MTRESLSALLDGECAPAEMDRLLADLESSPELMKEWTRLCLAREAREGTRVTQDQPCICAGVMAGLDEMEDAPNPRVVQLAARRRAYWNPFAGIDANGPAAAIRPLAGLAVAASVAVVAVMVSLPSRHAETAGGSLASAGGSLIPQAVTQVSLPLLRRSTPGLRAVSLRQQPDAEQQEELDKLLLEHNGSVAEQGMSGTLRYARFVAQTAAYNPQSGDQP